MFFYLRFILVLFIVQASGSGVLAQGIVFPGKSWETKAPGEVGLNAELLTEVSNQLGGRGCVIKDGYVDHAWGEQDKRGDWMSSAKPVLSTLLFFALEEGLVKSVDQPIAEFGWEFKEKDKGITFRHLGAMTSGYARPEGPGEAWAYNDFAIQLYQQTLFDKVFKQDPKEAAEAPSRFGALGLEDGLAFREKNRRISASVRDFARIAWFWINEGKWGDQQVLPAKYFVEFKSPQVAGDIPITKSAETDDYLGIGTYGGGSDHFSHHGPGIYGFNWWFNGKGGGHPDSNTWPAAPPDAFMSIGARGNSTFMVPSLNLALVCADGDWGNLKAGDPESEMNRLVAKFLSALSR